MNLNRQSATQNVIAGIFDDYSDAERAIRNLEEAGISPNRIGIATSQNGVDSQSSDGGQHEGFWRKIADFFEGKDYSGDASDSTSLDSTAYPASLGSGAVLVSVNALTPEERQECKEILEENRAKFEPSDSDPVSLSKAGSNVEQSSQGTQRIQLLSEVLRVQKERVSKGEVRLRKEVVTENQTVEVPVTREELVIENIPVEAGTPATGEIGSNQEVRVPLSEETVRVEKKPIVKEEIRVGTKRVQESKRVNEQVQREELHVDREGEVNVEKRPNKKGAA